MAVIARPNDAEIKIYLAENAGADLLFLWTESQVPLNQQWDLTNGGYGSIRSFIGIDDSRAGVRAACAADFQLDVMAAAPAGPNSRRALASIVSAWEIACNQTTRETQLRVEAKLMHIPRPISMQDRSAMRRAVEALYGPIPDHECPSAEYVASKMEELEENEPQAAQLDEVSNLDDIETSSMVAQWDSSGKVQMVRKKGKVAMPSGPEQFRMRLRIERNLWLFMATKFSNRNWLTSLRPSMWDTYCDYFLGKKVLLMEVPIMDSAAKVSLSPPWSMILSYEQDCRKAVFKSIRERGSSMEDALLAVCSNSEIREFSFTAPIALAGRTTRKWKGEAQDEGEDRKKRKGEGKGRKGRGKGNGGGGKGKGGSQGKGKGKGKLLSKTPDARAICFAYNGEGCTDPSCSRVHICRVPGCGLNHSMKDHV